MELHEKLNHLSDDQIKEVINLYLDENVKLSEIIKKYRIDTSPSQFVRLLPPRKVTKKCIHCGEPLYQNYGIRSLFRNCGKYDDELFCIKCGHKTYSENIPYIYPCKCDGCQALAELDIKKKKELIKRIYVEKTNNLGYEVLPLDYQIMLLYVILHNPRCSVELIEPCSSGGYYQECISELNKIGIISVSGMSSVDAFKEEDFPKRFYPGMVCYDINVSFADATVKRINENKFFTENYGEEYLYFYLKGFMADDLTNRFADMLSERGLELKDYDKQYKQMTDLLDYISYTQVLYICKRVAVYWSDKVLTREIPKWKANNIVMTQVKKYYDRAVENDWYMHNAKIEDVGDRLDFYIRRVMGREKSILNEVIMARII